MVQAVEASSIIVYTVASSKCGQAARFHPRSRDREEIDITLYRTLSPRARKVEPKIPSLSPLN